MKRNLGFIEILRAAEDGNGSAEAPSPESVLYPDEGGDSSKGNQLSTQEPVEKKGDDGANGNQAETAAGEWKDYTPDPAKSEAENAAAKAEHDKTKPEDKPADPLDTVPETGVYELKMPDGIELNKPLLDKISPRLKEKGYTQREAQQLADDFIDIQKEQVKQQEEQWGKTVYEDWPAQAKADKEIGGGKWDTTVSSATRAINSLGTPELKEYLTISGGGNHPELIRFMAKVGSMIREDSPAIGNAGGGAKDRSEVLYPDDQPKGN